MLWIFSVYVVICFFSIISLIPLYFCCQRWFWIKLLLFRQNVLSNTDDSSKLVQLGAIEGSKFASSRTCVQEGRKELTTHLSRFRSFSRHIRVGSRICSRRRCTSGCIWLLSHRASAGRKASRIWCSLQTCRGLPAATGQKRRGLRWARGKRLRDQHHPYPWRRALFQVNIFVSRTARRS